MKPSLTSRAPHRSPLPLRARWLLSLCAALAALTSLAALASLAALSPAVAQEQAPLPKFAKARIGTDRWGASIRATAFGPDDAVAVTYDNGFARLWNPSTQHLVWETRLGTQPLTAVTFAGSKTVVVTAEDGTTTLLNAADGRVTKTFKLDLCNKACELQEILASDKVLLTLGVIQNAADKTNQSTLRLWSLSDGKRLQTHVAANISGVALSPDGAHVAWSAFDQPAPAYLASAAAMPSAKPLTCPITSWNDKIQSMLFTPDSETFALFGSHDTTDSITTCMWSTDTAAPLHTIDIPAGSEEGLFTRLRAVVSSTDSKWLLVSFDEGTYGRDDFYVTVSPTAALNLTSGELTPPHLVTEGVTWAANHSAAPFNVYKGKVPVRAQSQGAELTLTTSGDRWGTTTRIPPQWLLSSAHTGAIQQLAASPDGAEVISVDRFNRALRWRTGGGDSPARTFQAYGQLLYTPDGLSALEAHPAVLQDDGCRVDPRMGNLGLWNLTTMTRATLRLDPKLMIQAARWLPDGRLLTCREQHDADEANCGYSDDIINSYFEALSPNGQTVAPLKGDFMLCPTAAGISPATSRAITFDTESIRSDYQHYKDTEARVQDLTTGDILFVLPEGVPSDAALSPDGKWVAYINNDNESYSHRDTLPRTLRVFSVDAQAEVSSSTLTEMYASDHGGPVAFFSPDNRLIYSDGATLRVADPTLGADAPAKALTLSGHTASVSAATFSADGKTLFTAQYDGLIFAWDWPALTAP
jgi:WD40 repeat protein